MKDGENKREVDIEQIMREIREDIQAKGYDADILSFEDMLTGEAPLPIEVFDKIAFNESIAAINHIWQLPYEYPLPESKGALRKIKMLLKKSVRRLIRFHIDAIITAQVERNANFVRLFNQVNVFIGEQMNANQNEGLAKLEFHVKRTMQRQINRCIAENAALKEENANLQRQIRSMETKLQGSQTLDERLKLLELKTEQLQIKAER